MVLTERRVRLPDFLLIGTMKSGTTTLFRWLEAHPGTAMPRVKEPGFFSNNGTWRRGLDWYGSLFDSATDDVLTGEASVDYTDPSKAAIAADRINRVIPGVRLLCLLRHPIDRMRSHYRHEVQRGRERAAFPDAVTRPGNPYVERSDYYECLLPYLDRFEPSALGILRFESLVDADAEAWFAALRHVGLEEIEPPGTAFNVTEEKEQYTRAMRFLWERGVVDRVSPLIRATGMRHAARRVLLRRDEEYDSRLSHSKEDPVPPAISEMLWASTARLESALDLGPLWELQETAETAEIAASSA